MITIKQRVTLINFLRETECDVKEFLAINLSVHGSCPRWQKKSCSGCLSFESKSIGLREHNSCNTIQEIIRDILTNNPTLALEVLL